MRFGKHVAVTSGTTATGSMQHRFEFPNGYGASVVRGPFTYGGPAGLWELAVVNLESDELDYSTPITSGVEGHLTDCEVAVLLDRIEAL